MADIDYTKGQIYRNGVYYGGNGSGGSGISADIVDNLESEDPEKALSANMGRELDEKKMDIPARACRVNGTDNEGKVRDYVVSSLVRYLASITHNGVKSITFAFDKHTYDADIGYERYKNYTVDDLWMDIETVPTGGAMADIRYPICGYIKNDNGTVSAAYAIKSVFKYEVPGGIIHLFRIYTTDGEIDVPLEEVEITHFIRLGLGLRDLLP